VFWWFCGILMLFDCILFITKLLFISHLCTNAKYKIIMQFYCFLCVFLIEKERYHQVTDTTSCRWHYEFWL